ncbi:MAG: hypothetical protein ACRDVZ_17810, partial [Jiangellaceae bacterium]
MTYIYVASSWRNPHYRHVVSMLRACGASRGVDGPHFGMHDFRDPAGYFTWASIDPEWESWDPATFRDKLHHPEADVGWERDKAGLDKAT